jgi:hypothetical protein
LNQIWADEGGECYADASCKDAMPTGATSKCGTVDVLYRHIKTLLFVLENQYDNEQIFAELGVPVPDTPKGVVLIAEYLKYYGERMRKSLSQIAAPNGLWNPACLDHCDTFYPSIMTVNISGVGDGGAWETVSTERGRAAGTSLRTPVVRGSWSVCPARRDALCPRNTQAREHTNGSYVLGEHDIR